MADLSKFRKLTLTDLAVALDVHPFDLIRTLVSLDQLPSDHRFEAADVEHIRKSAGLELWWTPLTRKTMTPDAPAQGLLQDLCHQLVERGVVGEAGTRLDNLLRGLSEDERPLVLQLVRGLVTSELVRSWSTAAGVQVSIIEGQEYVVADLSEGGTPPDAIAALWG